MSLVDRKQYRRISKRTQVMAPWLEDRFLCSFSHIFAGGYTAGYYSYKWAEVLAADTFSAVSQHLSMLDYMIRKQFIVLQQAVKEIGHRLRETVLALKGGKAPLEVFVEFRGRESSPEALLRHNGLLPVPASA